MAYGYRRYNRRPYRRTYTRRSRYSSRSSGMSNMRSAFQVAQAAYRGVKYLRGLVNVEKKKSDAESVSTVSTTPAPYIYPSAIGQGDGDQDRNGNSILVNGLLVRGTATINSSSAHTRVRILVIQDNQQIADTTPAFADIIDTAFADQILAPLNNISVGRFSILMDRVVTVDSNRPQVTFQKYFKMSHHIRYNGPATLDVQKGGLYVLAVSDEVTNTPALTLQSRIYYYDN